MDYKQIVLKLLKKFPRIRTWEVIKLNRYFLEYARSLAELNGIDTIKEYKRTSKLIDKYTAAGHDCFGKVWIILDIYDQISKTQTQYSDTETMLNSMLTTEELEEIECLVEILETT